MTADHDDRTPILRVVNPDATPEEVAALVAVFSALQTPATPSQAPSSEWPVPNRLRRSDLLRPCSWRATAHAH
ncbi:acyl-CoA carboxylase subunit epsilon [Nocardioides astragali]|uniref:Acyl-CoA carboxylase subunit epsilon n=1 Tax=Nocardioides astragali TaxID=1776736 RepID=A0ABW2N993_9ACTN|nr:acyl-CoA carboxylase subunit epsilon [Nocardioides astragali]